MPAASAPKESAFKHWFDATRYRTLGTALAALEPRFDQRRFLALTLDGLEDRELMDRMRQTAVAFAASLPGNYRQQLTVLRRLAPQVGHGFAAISLCDFVAREGLEDFEHSLEALRYFTRFGSAEFAVRPFLQRDLARALAILETWTQDGDEHVRRLASEGSRPRLPWGLRLSALVRDPSPAAPILEALKADPALYVRKSVANHLNDITKDHPAWVVARVTAWDRTRAETAWIVHHALRSLIKAGDPAALGLIGAGAAPVLEVNQFAAAPGHLKLGGTLALAAQVTSRAATGQRLVIDYIIHYARAGDATSRKVFKWKTVDLPAGGTVTLKKRQVIRDFSIRRHHPGRHRVELQINGRRLAETAFTLQR